MMCGSALLTVMLLVGQPAQGADVENQVRDLVRQLGADTIEERDAAEKQLHDMGPTILEQLPVANPRMTREMQQRVARIRLHLEQRRATASADGSRITLKVHQRPLSEVLAALEKLSGNKIINGVKPAADGMGAAEEEPKITLDVKDVLFWQALNEVLDQAHLTVNVDAASDEGKAVKGIVVETPLVPLSPRVQRSSCHGAFCFQPITIMARRGLADPGQNLLQVQVEALWEPRLSPILMTFSRQSLAVVFNDGTKTGSSKQGTEPLNVGGTGSTFALDLNLPPPKVDRIKQIKGELKALLPGRIETFRFGPLPGTGKFQDKKAEVTLFVDRVAKNGDTWEVAVRLKFDDAAGALQSHLLGWVEENQAWLESPDGKKVQFGSYQPTQEGESEYGVRYVFGIPEIAGYTFVYSTPAALVEKTVPFELKNLELP